MTFAITRVAASVLALFAIVACSHPDCKNEAFYGLPSPDGAFIAFVFHRTCATPSALSTEVTVMPSSESLRSDPANILSVPGQQPVKVAWRGARVLFVTGFANASYRRTQPLDSIRIEY